MSTEREPLIGYYWGCLPAKRMGHYLYNQSLEMVRNFDHVLPFKANVLDSNLIPVGDGKQPQGKCHRVLFESLGWWTVITFWDRSGDTRAGSNSAFIIQGKHNKAMMVQLAKDMFPSVFQRFTFPVE